MTYDIIGQNYDIIGQNYDIIVSTMISGVPRLQMSVPGRDAQFFFHPIFCGVYFQVDHV